MQIVFSVRRCCCACLAGMRAQRRQRGLTADACLCGDGSGGAAQIGEDGEHAPVGAIRMIGAAG